MRKWSVESHPRSRTVVKAIIEGKESQRSIAKRFGLSAAAIQRYLHGRLIPQAAKAAAAQEKYQGTQLLEQIERVMERMHKLYAACDEYLTDPHNTDRYTLIPHAHELDVIYSTEEDGRRDGETRTVQHKDSLKNLLDQALKQPAGDLIEVRYRNADPRKLIIDTANTLTKQLELLARICGELKDNPTLLNQVVIYLPVQQSEREWQSQRSE